MSNKHKYQLIAEDIRNAIIRGELTIGKQLPTEMETVKKYSTSRPTVTKAMEVLVSQGYIVREQGRGSFVADRDKEMKVRTMKVISLILPFGSESSYHRTELEMIRGAEAALKRAGYYLMIHYATQDADEEIDIIRKCRYEISDGIIVYPSSLNDMFLELFDMALDDYPMVFLTRMSDPSFLFVGSDNIKVGQQAASHLIECGYDETYFVSPIKISSNYTIRERFMGFTNVLKSNGRSINRNAVWEYEGLISTEELRDRVAKAISGSKRVSFFATDESIALQLLQVLDDLQVAVPEKVGVVGVDSHDIFIDTRWQISSVQQDTYHIGETAANVIIDRLKGKLPNSPATTLDVSFLKGNTT